MYLSEKYQLWILEDYFEQKGYDCAFEVNLYSIPIDIIAKRKPETVAIEMKSQNSKRGIEQAQRNQRFVDKSYLSVWEVNVTDRLIKRAEGLDVGLLSVGDEVKQLSEPTLSDPNPYARERAIKRVENEV